MCCAFVDVRIQIISPLRSRCLSIRVAAPTIGEVVGVLFSVLLIDCLCLDTGDTAKCLQEGAAQSAGRTRIQSCITEQPQSSQGSAHARDMPRPAVRIKRVTHS